MVHKLHLKLLFSLLWKRCRVDGFSMSHCDWLLLLHLLLNLLRAFFFRVRRTCVVNTLASPLIFLVAVVVLRSRLLPFNRCELFLRSLVHRLIRSFVGLLSFNLLNYVIVRARLADYINHILNHTIQRNES